MTIPSEYDLIEMERRARVMIDEDPQCPERVALDLLRLTEILRALIPSSGPKKA